MRNPAVVLKEPRSVYFSGQLGRLYWRLGLPHYEQLILGSILWAGGTPPIRERSSRLFLLEPHERRGQLVAHLPNLTYDRSVITRSNTSDQLMWHFTVETVMPPRHAVPSEVEVETMGYELLRAWSPLTGREYPVGSRGVPL